MFVFFFLIFFYYYYFLVHQLSINIKPKDMYFVLKEEKDTTMNGRPKFI